MSCQMCGRPMRPKKSSAEDYPGTIQAYSKALCGSCGHRRDKGNAGPAKAVRPVSEVVEDVLWLIETGENIERAARRLGYASVDSLERSLWRCGRGDLCTKFARLYEVAS